MNIDEDFKIMTACKIQAFKPIFNGNEATHLGVRIAEDDLKQSAYFLYVLYSSDGTELLRDTILCEGVDYLNWNGDNLYPFSFTASKLGITFI